MQATYELFDHTADIGFRVRAPELRGLVVPAGEALYAVIGQLVATGDPQPNTFELVGEGSAGLLRDYLNELLFLFERRARFVTSLKVPIYTDQHLTVAATTRLVDMELSVFHREVKAITYHELDVCPIPGGYQATVIVDI